MKRKRILCLLFAISIQSVSGIYADTRSYECRLLSDTPVLDGEIDKDIAWSNRPSAGQFTNLGTNTHSKKQTEFKVGYTADAMYIAIKCFDSDIAKIKAELDDNESLWYDDSIELFISAARSKEYLHIVCNTSASRWNAWGNSEQCAPLLNWQAKVHKGVNFYSLEIEIPFEIFEQIPSKDEIWRFNVSRNITTSEEKFSTWANLDGGFHQLQKFGGLVFVGEIDSLEYKKSKERILIIKRKEIKEALAVVKGEMEKALSISHKYKITSGPLNQLVSNYNNLSNRCDIDSSVEASEILNDISALKRLFEEQQFKLLLESFFINGG